MPTRTLPVRLVFPEFDICSHSFPRLISNKSVEVKWERYDHFTAVLLPDASKILRRWSFSYHHSFRQTILPSLSGHCRPSQQGTRGKLEMKQRVLSKTMHCLTSVEGAKFKYPHSRMSQLGKLDDEATLITRSPFPQY
jgi:hypothetical protein